MKKWPNYQDMAGRYLMPHKYHLALHFWWGTVLRVVAVVEDKDEILFEPWWEQKLGMLLVDSELEPKDWDSTELNVFWHKNKALLLLVLKDVVSWCKKEAQDVAANDNRRFFWFIILPIDASKARDVSLLSLAKWCCVTDDTGGVISFIIVPIHQWIIGMVCVVWVRLFVCFFL